MMSKAHGFCTRRARLARVVLTLLLGVTALASSSAPVQAAGAEPVRLGYFWQPPTDGTSVQKLAQTAELVTVSQGKEGYRKQLREAGFTGLALQYQQIGAVDGPGPYTNSSANCNSTYQPLHNQPADQVGDFCTFLHPNENWFLHNSKGQRLYGLDNGRGKYYMNPANPGWRTFASQRMLTDFTTLGYDGFHIDNLDVSMFRLKSQLANSNGIVKEFSSETAYRDAYVGYLSVLSAAIRPAGVFWANMTGDPHTGSSWNPFMRYLDGGMYEAFATGYVSGNGLSVTKWEGDLKQAEWVLANGKGILALSQGHQGDSKKQSFALASYLLVTNSTTAYFRYSKAASYGEWWLYPNYEVSLGQPKGARYKLTDGNWRRNFACGYVIADPVAQTGKIVTTGC